MLAGARAAKDQREGLVVPCSAAARLLPSRYSATTPTPCPWPPPTPRRRRPRPHARLRPARALAEMHRILRPGACSLSPNRTGTPSPSTTPTWPPAPPSPLHRRTRQPQPGHQPPAPPPGRQRRIHHPRGPRRRWRFTDYTTEATILGLPRTTERAVTAGYLSREAAHQWLTHLATQPLTAACTMFAVLARA